MAFAGMEWIVVVIAIVLLLFGAKKIPELARSIGKAMGEVERGKRMVEMELRKAEREAMSDDGPGSQEKPAPRAAAGGTGSPLREAAAELGIATDGRSDQELKELIRNRVTGE